MKPITRYKPLLQKELDDLLRVKQAEQTAGIWGADFLDRLRLFAGSGKLLRGSLVCFSYRAWTARRPTKEVTRAALAIELAHSALLVHDDIMDGDELRRGHPSLHRQYEIVAKRRRLDNPPGFGVSMALSGGDIALLIAFELLSHARQNTQQLFTDQLLRTCGGQMQDVYFGAAAADPKKSEIYGVMEQKTASYTIALPLTMGAALASQSSSTIQELHTIGTLIGTIFQIRDDELGVLGSRRLTGKPVGADVRENKKTLPHYYLMEQCTNSERTQLAGIFGNSRASYTDIRFVQSLLRKYKITEIIAKDVERIGQRVRPRIEQLAIDRPSKQALLFLVDYCSKRQF